MICLECSAIYCRINSVLFAFVTFIVSHIAISFSYLFIFKSEYSKVYFCYSAKGMLLLLLLSSLIKITLHPSIFLL